jgi:hypothetical protein
MNMDHEATLRVAMKTRRAVRDAVITDQEGRVRQRRNLGMAIAGFVALLMLSGPAIWNGMEDLMAGEHILDLPVLIAVFVLMLLLSMLAALIAVWRGQRDLDHDRGGFETFRPIEK